MQESPLYPILRSIWNPYMRVRIVTPYTRTYFDVILIGCPGSYPGVIGWHIESILEEDREIYQKAWEQHQVWMEKRLQELLEKERFGFSPVLIPDFKNLIKREYNSERYIQAVNVFKTRLDG
jgi:hypothetical protein